MQPVQNITVDDRVSRTQYQYTLEDPDVAELDTWASRFVDKLQKLPTLEDVATDQQTGGLTVSLAIDRVSASRLGIAPSTLDQTLYDAFGQRQINTMYTQLNQYHVIMEAMPGFTHDPKRLNKIYIQGNASSGASGAAASTSFSASASATAGSNATTTSALYTPSSGVLTPPQNGIALGASASTGSSSPNTATGSNFSNAVPLDAFAKMEQGTESLSINHQGQFPSVTVSFNLAPDASLGEAINDINKAAKDINFPASVQAGFQGTAAAFENSLDNEALLILAALVTVYIVLGVLYESFIHPITILSTLPSAGVGALLSLILFKQNLSVVAIIGIILLIGIVKKNGIMMVDFALEGERQRGLSSTEAIYEASLLRFRPIMMTTMAALLGGIPLAVGTRHRLRASPSAGHRHGGRIAAEPGAHPLHHAGHLHLLRQPVATILPLAPGIGAGAGPRARSPRVKREPLRSFYSPAGGHNPADGGDRHRRRHRVQRAARFAAAPGGLPHHFCLRRAARSQRADHGLFGGHSAGAPVRPHRGRHGDDLVEFAGQHQRDPAIRPEPQHRRRRARRRSRHQCGQNLPAREPAVQSQLSQGESRGFAHHDHRPHLRQVRQRGHVRLRLDHHAAEALADSGRGPGERRRRVLSIGAGRRQSSAAEPLRNYSGNHPETAEPAKFRSRPRSDHEQHGDGRHRHQRPDLQGRRIQAADRRLSQWAGRPSFRRGRRTGFGAEYSHRRLPERDSVGNGHHLSPARRQHHPDQPAHSRSTSLPRRRHAPGNQDHDCSGPHHDHQGFPARCGDVADPLRHPGDPGRLFISAQWPRHSYPQRRCARLPDRHLRGDVSARLQPG